MLNNGVSSGLSQIIRQLGTANAAATTLNSNLGRLKLAAAGAVAILGGEAIWGGFKKLVEHGKEVNNQLERMKQAGMSYQEIQQAIVQAQKTSSEVMTTTYSENLKHMLELRYAFGENEAAMHHMGEISKANSILNAMRGGGKDQVWEFVKSLEGKGLTFDPAAFSSYLNTMTQVVQATGGRVTPEQFYNTFKYGRTATQLWDQNFIGGALPRLIQEMSSGGGGGAGGPGNALMTGFAKMVQGQMSKASAEELKFLGLGSATKIKGSGSMLTKIPSADQFAKNPYEWTQNVLGPAMAKAGIDMKNDVAVAQHIQKLFGVRTIADAITKMMFQGRFMHGENAPFEKDIRLQKQGLGLDEGFKALEKGHYETVLKEFNAQWTRLLETLGGPTMLVAIPVMRAMADAMEAVGRFAANHPEGIKIALEALAALGAGLFVAGLVALGAAIAGLIGVGGILVAVAAGLAALAALNWDSIKSTFVQIGPSILEALKTAASIVIGGVPGIFAGIGAAILSALKSAVAGAVGGLGLHNPFSNPNNSGGGAVPPVGSPMNYRSAPPSRGGGGGVTTANLIVDGQKLGKVVTKHMARSGSAPTEGSVYTDATRMALRNDTSYAV